MNLCGIFYCDGVSQSQMKSASVDWNLLGQPKNEMN